MMLEDPCSPWPPALPGLGQALDFGAADNDTNGVMPAASPTSKGIQENSLQDELDPLRHRFPELDIMKDTALPVDADEARERSKTPGASHYKLLEIQHQLAADEAQGDFLPGQHGASSSTESNRTQSRVRTDPPGIESRTQSPISKKAKQAKTDEVRKSCVLWLKNMLKFSLLSVSHSLLNREGMARRLWMAIPWWVRAPGISPSLFFQI